MHDFNLIIDRRLCRISPHSYLAICIVFYIFIIECERTPKIFTVRPFLLLYEWNLGTLDCKYSTLNYTNDLTRHYLKH